MAKCTVCTCDAIIVTIACWLKETLKLAGIDVPMFTGHSVRGASISAAASVGVTGLQI